VKDLVIIGAGGFGREIAQYIRDINEKYPEFNILGFVDEDKNKRGKKYEGTPVLGDFSDLPALSPLYAVCGVADPKAKEGLVEKALKSGIRFVNVIHPSAYITGFVEIGEGVVVGPGCTITINVKIGNHVSINPGCGIGHDAAIGDYTTLYWNVNVSGNVEIGRGVQVGTGAFIKQGLQVGEYSRIGAMAAVVGDVEKGVTVAGVPAKRI
jgi:sugar O-acyltransferase (sialic acid O-acetyltransferase NeuD family)